MLNDQRPVTRYNTTHEQVYIHSIFKTIQGEGPLVGTPSIFVRLHGCNLQCPLCDTDYTKGSEILHIKEVVQTVLELSLRKVTTVVITGGEPFNQDISGLIDQLYLEGFNIQVETNGTIYREEVDYSKIMVVCSPKTGSVHKKLQPYIHSYKYVGNEEVSKTKDGLPQEVLGLKTRSGVFKPPLDSSSLIYLQPVDCGDEYLNKVYTDSVVESCMRNNYILCLQTHKIIEVE